MIQDKWWVGTLQQLWDNTEVTIRFNAEIPNQLGTLNWAMSGEGETPVVLPSPTTVEGIYASPVPKNKPHGKAWGRFTAEQLKLNITWPETDESNFKLLEE